MQVSLQADSYSASMTVVESHLQQSLRKKGIPWPNQFSLRFLIDRDRHFTVEPESSGDVQVCCTDFPPLQVWKAWQDYCLLLSIALMSPSVSSQQCDMS